MANKTNMFDPESPIVVGFETARDLLFLNILTILCSIPMVTIVPAFTALHYTVLKMVRNEEGYVSKTYFKSFKENLKQGIWGSVLLIAVVAFVAYDFYAISLLDVWFADLAFGLLIVICIAFAITITFFFPCMAKLSATVRQNIANAFKMGVSRIHITLLMIIINVLPFVIAYFVNVLSPVLFLYGFSVPAILNAKFYDKIFKKLEDDFNNGQNV